jgi:predicted amidohydrolase
VGSASASYRQRVPIPVAMWGNGYTAAPLSPSVVRIDGHRAAVLLCYEQLLPITELLSLAAHPDVILAPSNLYWAPASVYRAESVTVRAWARLAGIPVLQAVNR